MKFKSFQQLAAIVIACSSISAMASGSDGGGSAATGDTQAYNTGKLVYATKLGCSSCVMAGKSLDAAAAKNILTGKAVSGLSEDESRALAFYLNRRFKL